MGYLNLCRMCYRNYSFDTKLTITYFAYIIKGLYSNRKNSSLFHCLISSHQLIIQFIYNPSINQLVSLILHFLSITFSQTITKPNMQGISQSRRQKSSLPQSPTRNEIDFMAQKLLRLEDDYNDVCTQLQRVRTRLRKAEDFEIKYELLNKQKLTLQQQMMSKDAIITGYESRIKELQVSFNEKKSQQIQGKVEKDTLIREVQNWRVRFLQAQQISSRIRAQQEYKMSERLSTELQLMKKQFINQEQEFRSRIRMLEITLAEKEALESVLREKGEKGTGEKEKEIERLQENLSKAREQHLKYAQEKNTQIKQVAQRFQQLFTHQIQNLKHLQETNTEKFSLQVTGLKGLLQLKNNQIQQLIQQSNQMRQSYLEEKTELLKEISLLREKLFQRQREGQLELYNLKERLMTLHRLDLQQMSESFEKINLNLEDNIRELEELIKKKDKDIADITARFEERRAELQQIIDQKDTHITQLQQKLRHTSDITAKQIDNLHSSFHKITTQKGQLSTEYESTFTFLNNQITKLTSSNQLKNQEIKQLHLEISQVKKNFSEHVKELERKWRQERKEREEERMREREVREQLEVEFREKEQKWRHRERILERDKQREQREKIKQKVSIQELQKNVQRLSRHVKENQQRLKQQMQRNQSSFVQSGTVRRQLTGELQRQRTQFQAIKKMHIDQVHRQYEIETARLNNQNQRLLNQLSQLRISFDKLEEEYKKVMNTKKNVERINKEKAVDYQRKMAALNAEINLTQNLYNSFLTAKSKTVRKPSESAGN